MLEKRCEMLEKCDRNPGQMLEKRCEMWSRKQKYIRNADISLNFWFEA